MNIKELAEQANVPSYWLSATDTKKNLIIAKFADLIAAAKRKDCGISKKEALQIIRLLSAMESWAFSQATRLPDYLVDGNMNAVTVLERIILEQGDSK